MSSQSLHGWSGANGVFSFPIRELLNWSDRNSVKLTFSFQSKSDLQDDLLYTLFDYIRLYTNQSDLVYFWQEATNMFIEIHIYGNSEG